MSKIDCPMCGSPNPAAGNFCVYCSKPLRPSRSKAAQKPAKAQKSAPHESTPGREASRPKLIAAVIVAGIVVASIALVFLLKSTRTVGPTASITAASATGDLVAPGSREELKYSFPANNGKMVTASVFSATQYGEGRKLVVFAPSMDRTDANLYTAALQALLNVYGKERGTFSSKEPQTETEGRLGGSALFWNVPDWRERFYSLPINDPASGKLGSMVVWLDNSHAAADEALFRTRIAANEEAVIDYLHLISLAEVKFSESNSPDRYGTLDKLLDGGYVQGRKPPAQAYRFELRVTNNSFEAFATPVKYNSTGIRSFYLSSKDFSIRGTDKRGLEATAKDPPIE